MGIFDDMAALLGKGMDAADKKTQELRFQSELTRINADKEKALAELGRAVLLQKGSDPVFISAFADQVKSIGDFEAQEKELKRQIEAIQRGDVLVSGGAMQTANAAVQGHTCPACGAPVALEAMFCQACGDNLAALKAQFKKCPKCNAYYSEDSTFCERCGSRIEELEVAPVASTPPADPSDVDDGETCDSSESVPDNSTANVNECQHCGATLRPGAVFCASCGKRLEEAR